MDRSLLSSLCWCSLPRFADSQAADADPPPYDELDPEKQALDIVNNSSGLPQRRNTNTVAVNFVQFAPPRLEPPPRYPGLLDELSSDFSSSLVPKPLRVGRKRDPPTFVESRGAYRYQTVSYPLCRVHRARARNMSASANTVRPDATATTTRLPAGPRPQRRAVQGRAAGRPAAPAGRHGLGPGHVERRLARRAAAAPAQQGRGHHGRPGPAGRAAAAGRHEARKAATRAEPRRRAGAQGPPAGRRVADPAVSASRPALPLAVPPPFRPS